MKFPMLVFMLLGAAVAQQPASTDARAIKPCVIVKPASTAHRALVSNKAFQYVEGEFPSKMKFKSNVGDGDVRKVKELGGKVVVIKADYTLADLQDAREQCKKFQAASTQ